MCLSSVLDTAVNRDKVSAPMEFTGPSGGRR